MNPYKFVGLGSRIPTLPPHPLASSEYPFGLRPVALDSMKELSSLMDEPKAMSELASKLLGEKTISSNEAVESPAILQGPIMQSDRPLDGLSTAQTKLDEKLRRSYAESLIEISGTQSLHIFERTSLHSGHQALERLSNSHVGLQVLNDKSMVTWNDVSRLRRRRSAEEMKKSRIGLFTLS